MKIHQLQEREIFLSDLAGDEIQVSLEHEYLYFGAIGMFVASIGRCTFAVLREYAMRLDLPVKALTIRMEWGFADEKVTRIEKINFNIHWPELPASRLRAVERASHQCALHNTVKNCIAITSSVSTDSE